MQHRRIQAKGIVQGVGFRPFIYRLAQKNNIAGWVTNTSGGVKIEAEGTNENLETFVREIETKAPPLANIHKIKTQTLPLANYQSFVIKESLEEKDEFLPVSPDSSICDECLKELFSPPNRRYRYPFVNCTNCGPRFTIIKDIPYDRPKTTMKKFKMCSQCQAEYEDPLSRRFHAQPNACPECGPKLEFRVSSGELRGKNPIEETIKALKEGKIVAIKGLGGFHLACDAMNDRAVKSLRLRKKRSHHKPFAVMFCDVRLVRKHCYLNREEEKVLTSPQRPIILLRKRAGSNLSDLITPNNNYLGAMLPYTPVHYLLLRESQMVLVMTSGNVSEEPIAMGNEEAFERLEKIADSFLIHNRDIYSRYDDSVVRVVEGDKVMIRRARSYAPSPLVLPKKFKEILAVGGELKNTFCLTKENYAFLSQHMGDMENIETYIHFEVTLNLYKRLFRVKPKIVVYDLHPDYLTTRFAKALRGGRKLGVQHHHAHIASCMAENNISAGKKVIGVAFDGTGFGLDGTIWGGEFLIASYQGFRRAAHLGYVPMPGGETAIAKPYRMSLSFLHHFFGLSYREFGVDFLKELDSTEATIIEQQIDKGLNSPLTSSCGRLFDAVSALLGVCAEQDYEGQAAIELEMIADEKVKESYNYRIVNHESGIMNQRDTLLIVDTKPIFEGIVADLQNGVAREVISAKFHNTIVDLVVGVCVRLGKQEKIKVVALSGGVWQNVILLTKVKKRLAEAGFTILTQELVPTNDGGLSLGQAAIANYTFTSSEDKVKIAGG